MKYFAKAGNAKTKVSRVYADLTQGLRSAQKQKENCARDMLNFSSDMYPWLAQRQLFKRRLYSADFNNGVGIYDGKVYYVRNSSFYYDGVAKFEVINSKKTFYNYNGKIIIFPDMVYYQPATEEHGKLGVATDEITYKISNRTVGTVDFGLSSIHSDDLVLTDYFKVGDGIKITDEEGLGISGFHTITAVNVDEGILFFDKFEFGDGEGFTIKGRLTNGAPEVCDAACICGGRIWVAGGNKIYASTINDERNWAIGGDDEKSSFVCAFASGETITACVELEGSPVFFSEKKIYKVYGDRASNFYLKCCSNWGGIPKEMSYTVSVLKDKIFYISTHGVTYFDGSSPKILEDMPFSIDGEVYAASDEKKYYVFVDNEEFFMYVYDDLTNQWQKYGNYGFTGFLAHDGALYGHTKYGLFLISGSSDFSEQLAIEEARDSSAEFLIDTGGGCPFKVVVDIDCGKYAEYEIYISYDSDSTRNLIQTVKGEFSGVIQMPLVPRACEKLTVGIDGEGTIIVKELYVELGG